MRLILLGLFTTQMMFWSHGASSAPPQQGKCDYCGTVVDVKVSDGPSDEAKQLDEDLRKGNRRATSCDDLIGMEKSKWLGFEGGATYSSEYYTCRQRVSLIDYKVSFNAGDRAFRVQAVTPRFKVGDKVALVNGLLTMQEETKAVKPKAAVKSTKQ